MGKNSYDHCAYESVDDGNPSSVTSQELTEKHNLGSKGLITFFINIFINHE